MSKSKQRRQTGAIRYISLFSGVECASLALRPLGWEPLCFSEIEPFPCAVLAHRFPDVPNVGDMTLHDWSQYRGRCDVVIGGSPCQAFSIAGRRLSLADERGNLTLAYAEAINAIDPKVILWENVPGVLSDTKANAFGCFLSVLCGADAPLVPPAGKRWTNAGVAVGSQRQVAWRILDARHFGVPQRRRRVFLVGCSRTSGLNPAEILFERESLRGHSPQGGKAGEEDTGAVTACAGNGGRPSNAGRASAGYLRTAKCLTSKNKRIDFETEMPVAGTLGGGNRWGGNDLDRSDAFVVHTLLGNGFDTAEDGTGRGTPLIALHGSQELDVSGDVTHPRERNRGRETCVAYVVSTAHTRSNGSGISEGVAYTLAQSPGQAVAFTQNQAGDVLTGSVAPAIGTNANATGRNTAKVMTPGGEDTAQGVRRLTPKECERLQGIPDDHTLIPYRGKPAADGPRYKAIGNGMAVPCVGWVLQRIHGHFRGEF